MSSAAAGTPPFPDHSPHGSRPARGRVAGALRRRRRRLLPAAAGLVSVAGLLLSPAAPAVSGEPTAPRAAAAVAAPAAVESPVPRGEYGWPTGALGVVLEDFDPPAVRWGSGHRGVDLSLAAGSPVLAAADGTVAFAGTVAGRPVVSIDHADGIRTTYEPVEASVSGGDAVTRGQAIGTLVAGHRADGADALHWGARTGPKEYVNPLRLISPPVIRLKPVGGRG